MKSHISMTGTTVLGEFSELQYSLSPSYQAARLLVKIGFCGVRIFNVINTAPMLPYGTHRAQVANLLSFKCL